MRFLDIILSFIALLLLSPLFIVIAIILLSTGEHYVFFLQDRVGKHGKKFKIFKFVTMLKDSPNMGTGTITSKNDPRILPVGKFLRKSKINELPQLLNVLIGDMSLIGPRPHAERDLLGVENDVKKIVLLARPGLSGVGSIVFRNEEFILQKFDNPRDIYDDLIAPFKAELELWYVQHAHLGLYIKLIFATLYALRSKNSDFIYRWIPELPPPPFELQRLMN